MVSQFVSSDPYLVYVLPKLILHKLNARGLCCVSYCVVFAFVYYHFLRDRRNGSVTVTVHSHTNEESIRALNTAIIQASILTQDFFPNFGSHVWFPIGGLISLLKKLEQFVGGRDRQDLGAFCFVL